MQMAGDDVNGGSRSSPAGRARCGRGYRLSRTEPLPRGLATGLFWGETPKNDPPCFSSGLRPITCSAVSPEDSITSMMAFAASAAVSSCAMVVSPNGSRCTLQLRQAGALYHRAGIQPVRPASLPVHRQFHHLALLPAIVTG